MAFPFQALFRWDQDKEGKAVRELGEADWEHLVALNESAEIRSRRRVRLALRALEGQVVSIPYETGKGRLGRKKASGGVRYDRGVISSQSPPRRQGSRAG